MYLCAGIRARRAAGWQQPLCTFPYQRFSAHSRRPWFISVLSYDSTTVNQWGGTDTFLSVRAETFPQMFVSVHFHFCKSLVRCFCVQRKGHFIIPVSLVPCVAAFGADVVGCGVSQPLSHADLPFTFAPKRQGKAPGAYRRPRLRPSFGQPKGIGRPIPFRVVTGRFIPNPSGTDFCVL